jgi:alpha-1,2-mannosyltransferase
MLVIFLFLLLLTSTEQGWSMSIDRPEKEHSTQLRALKLFFDKHPERQSGDLSQRVELIMAGSVRGKEDEARVEILRNLAKELKIEVSFCFAL